MPTPLKPCEGKLDESTLDLLRASRDRARWGTYPCKACGQSVGVVITKGEWAAETHWPSVTYPPRKTGGPSRMRIPRG